MRSRGWLPVVVAVGVILAAFTPEVFSQSVMQRANPAMYAHPDVIRFQVHTNAIQVQKTAGAPVGWLNSGRIFVQTNGSGKLQLCVQFATGVAQCFATEP